MVEFYFLTFSEFFGWVFSSRADAFYDRGSTFMVNCFLNDGAP